MRRQGLLLALGVTAVLAGCGGAAPPGSPAPGPVATPPGPRSAVTPKEPEAGPPLLPAAYQAKQRRDPFSPQVVAEGGGKGLTVATVKLAGVVQGRGGPLGLVEAPDGIGYILKPGDVLGDGRVLEIGKDTISFSVPGRPGQAPSTVTLRLRTD